MTSAADLRSAAQVWDIMRAVDADGDGRLSRREFLAKIRRDRKYADFLRMPPRIKAGDGSLERFTEIFAAINAACDGYIPQNELAAYLGVKPCSAEVPSRGPSFKGLLLASAFGSSAGEAVQ